MKTPLFIFSALAAVVLAGCASSSSKSYVMIGERHAPVDPGQVKIYTHPPAKYEEVAWMKGSCEWAPVNPPRGMIMISDDLRAQAAKLGANGILVLRPAEPKPAATGSGSGDSSDPPGTVTESSGMAIYVTQE